MAEKIIASVYRRLQGFCCVVLCVSIFLRLIAFLIMSCG